MISTSANSSEGSNFDNSVCLQFDVLNAMSIPVITTSRDLTIVSVNDAAEKLLNMPSGAIIGEKYDLLFQFKESLDGECIAHEALRTKKPVSGQAIVNVKGQSIPVEYGAIPLADEKGQVTSVVNYMIDRSDSQLFFDEISNLGDRVKAGSLEARADVTNFPEPYQSALVTMNNTLDTMSRPLLDIGCAADQVAHGNSPVLLNSSTNGEMGELITSINALLQKETKLATEAMKESSKGVKEGNITVIETLKVFNQIAESITEIHTQMMEVAGATEEQSAATQEVTSGIHELGEKIQMTAREAMGSASSTEEVSSAVDQVNKVVTDAATEEVTAAIDQVTRAITDVSSSIQKISTKMGRFKVA